MTLFAFLLCFLGLAQADTLAVLPLDRAAASEEYDGLGKALAGMLVSDLSKVPGLELVERDRLQALMDEMKLAETGFLDEATAQKLGSGLGARFVLTGSYSVVKETFVLDARVIEVETGSIKKAADASGSVADFVTVEKDLVEALVEGLDLEMSSSIRRQVLVDAPTEDFAAFSAWGEGIERQDEGDLEAAREAYERALTRDPDFLAAQSSLSEVRALLESYKAERTEAYHAVYGEMNKRLIEAFPSELERSMSVEDDMDQMVGWALRLAALENEGRHCQRYQEMWHYLERNDFQISEPDKREGPDAEGREPGRFTYELGHEAEDQGFRRYDHSAGGPEIATKSINSRYSSLFETTPRFLMGQHSFHQVARNDPHSGLLWALQGCYPDIQDRLAEVERLQKALKKAGVDQLTDEDHYDAGVTLQDHLDLYWSYQQARWVGASPELTKKTEGLLRRVKVDPIEATEVEKERERFVVGEIEHIVRDAGNVTKWKRSRGGLSIDEAQRLAQALVDEDTAVFTTSPKLCSWSVEHAQGQARSYLDGLADLEEDDWMLINMRAGSGVSWYPALSRSGCVVGVEGEFDSLDEVVEHAKAAVSVYESTGNSICNGYMSGVEQMLKSMASMPEVAVTYEHFESTQAYSLLNFLSQVEAEGCLDQAS